MYVKNSHCSYCGSPFLSEKWPRVCLHCKNESYANPIPISVSLIPVVTRNEYGLLIIRRGNEPKVGEWAFPGGFLELGETWQQGAARELKEEVNLDLDPEKFFLLKVENATSGNYLIFNSYRKTFYLDDIPFIPNSEVTEIGIANEHQSLAFPIHTIILKEFFLGLIT